MVLKGPSNATDLNVLQGKLTKNLADLNTFETSMSLRDRVKTSKNLTPLTYLHMYTLPSSGSEVLRSYNVHR